MLQNFQKSREETKTVTNVRLLTRLDTGKSPFNTRCRLSRKKLVN